MISTEDPGNRREGGPPGKQAVQEMMRWIVGVVLGLVAFFGLVIAGRATTEFGEAAGLILFVVAVLVIFGMIWRYMGREGQG